MVSTEPIGGSCYNIWQAKPTCPNVTLNAGSGKMMCGCIMLVVTQYKLCQREFMHYIILVALNR